MPRSYNTRRCSACGRQLAPTERRARPSGRGACCRGEGSKPRSERAALVVITPGKRYADDVGAQLFVATFGAHASLEDVGEANGITRARAQQIIDAALLKARRACERLGVDVRALLDLGDAGDDVDEPPAARAAA